MNGFKEYLKGYVGGVKSLLVGMRTSMKVFCRCSARRKLPNSILKTAILHFTFRNVTGPCW